MEELRDWHALRAAGHNLQGASMWNNASSFPNQGCSEAARAARAYGAGAAASCTKEQFEARARRAFDRYDDEKCGRLGREGVKLAFMELFGYKPTRYELASLIGQSSSHTATLPHPECAGTPGATVEVDESGPEAQGSRIEFREFVEAMRPRAEEQHDEEVMRLAFKAIDRRSAGFLTLEDAKRAFREVAPHVRERLVEQVFFEFDADHDGRLTMAQFEALWRRGA